MSVTIFEGYDVTIFHLCTPDIARTFHLDDRAVGAMASFVRLGGMIAFIIVMLADRIGRKPLMSTTVLFYTLFTLLTAISRGLAHASRIFQSSAQVFLSAEFAVAIIMISEEFPDPMRGTGVAMLNMVGLLGVVAGGGLYGCVAESRWGWRGMYFIGVGPLLLVAFLRRGVRETGALRRARAARTPDSNGASTGVGALRQGRSRAASRAVSRARASWWRCYGTAWGWSGAPAVTFFSLYAKRDHHWTSGPDRARGRARVSGRHARPSAVRPDARLGRTQGDHLRLLRAGRGLDARAVPDRHSRRDAGRDGHRRCSRFRARAPRPRPTRSSFSPPTSAQPRTA